MAGVGSRKDRDCIVQDRRWVWCEEIHDTEGDGPRQLRQLKDMSTENKILHLGATFHNFAIHNAVNIAFTDQQILRCVVAARFAGSSGLSEHKWRLSLLEIHRPSLLSLLSKRPFRCSLSLKRGISGNSKYVIAGKRIAKHQSWV